MKLIVGLGNPGREYEMTRHNIGFMTIDKYASKLGVSITKEKFNGLYGETIINGEKIILSAQNNQLLIEQVPVNQCKNIKELFKDFKSENYSPCEIDWSKPVGDEIW